MARENDGYVTRILTGLINPDFLSAGDSGQEAGGRHGPGGGPVGGDGGATRADDNSRIGEAGDGGQPAERPERGVQSDHARVQRQPGRGAAQSGGRHR